VVREQTAGHVWLIIRQKVKLPAGHVGLTWVLVLLYSLAVSLCHRLVPPAGLCPVVW
jgi:hypothetical protein